MRRVNGREATSWMDVTDTESTPSKPNPSLNGSSRHARRKAMRSQMNGGSTAKLSALQEQRKQLPIASGKDALIREIRKNDVIILLGETGSGKTTQVPQYLLEAGIADKGMIAVTQPRRVAATSLAARVAMEQNTTVGKSVGYSVRFDEASSSETRIKYVTDGMLVRELLSDSQLSRYSVVIVDEAHERTLRTDMLVAYLKAIQQQRNGPADSKGNSPTTVSAINPLKIIIMSATLDAEKFSQFYHNAKVIYVKGRQHPVKIYHTALSQMDYVDAALRTFFQIHTDHPVGDVLIFLPGQEDIESLEKSIQFFASRLPEDRMEVMTCLMYGALPPSQQSKMFTPVPPNTRKCILATNIAETSITIPGIRYVIDTGKCKEKRYLTKDTGGFDTLMVRDITKSSAMQRAGRAGREGKGFCFRLYTEDAFDSMALSSDPEIRRCSLASPFLQLKQLGLNMEELEFMDKPDIDSVQSALKTLLLLGALDRSKELTNVGRKMANFPLDPRFSAILIASNDNECIPAVIDIISVLSSQSKLFVDVSDQRETAAEARQKFYHTSGDHMTTLNAFRSYEELAAQTTNAGRKDWCRKHFLNERALMEATKIREQLRVSCQRLGMNLRESSGDKDECVLKSLVRGLVQNSAFLQPNGTYKQVIGHSIVKIYPGSVLSGKKVPAIIFDELIYTTQIYARGVSAVSKQFITAAITIA